MVFASQVSNEKKPDDDKVSEALDYSIIYAVKSVLKMDNHCECLAMKFFLTFSMIYFWCCVFCFITN